jgi:hypothetical protein
MNKIYTMADGGKPLVSNILVTDIRNDLNRAITICSCDDAGIFYKEMPLTESRITDTKIVETNPQNTETTTTTTRASTVNKPFYITPARYVPLGSWNSGSGYITRYVHWCLGNKDGISIFNDEYSRDLVADTSFDGTKDGLYEPEDKPNPKSIYGFTKYLGELETKENPKHFIARVSWVFGINGNNFIKTMLRLSETRRELNVVNDQVGSPTYTVDLAKILVDMSETEEYGTYHVTNEDFCSWAEFAEYIFNSNNIEMKVNKITSDEYPQKAYRPRNSKMEKVKLLEKGFTKLPTWQNAVDRYNIELKEHK